MTQPSNSTEAPLRQKSHWILVVDDEESMRRVIIDTLSIEGLHGVPAESGEAALAILDASETEPLVVITDVLMPGMNGLTLARKLQGRLKHSTIILISGHLADSSWWPAELRELTFLAKPFQLSALTALVHAARFEYDRTA
jgi:two-component system cell cycle sensor histidine kinase/response regulator CckA